MVSSSTYFMHKLLLAHECVKHSRLNVNTSSVTEDLGLYAVCYPRQSLAKAIKYKISLML